MISTTSEIGRVLRDYQSRYLGILIGIAVTLPFSMRVNSAFIILLLINWFSYHKLSYRTISFQVLLPFFLMHLVGVLYSTNQGQAFFELEKKISFLIFPLVLSGSPPLRQEQVKKVLLAFVIACALAAIISLANAIYLFFATGQTEHFFYHPLTKLIDMHAIYMAMYCCFSIFILLRYYGHHLYSKRIVLIAPLAAVLSFLICFVLLLSARTVIVGFLLILLVGMGIYGFSQQQLLRSFLLSVLTVFISLALALLLPNNLERFKEAINYGNEYSIEKQYGGRSTRELIWRNSVALIKENPLAGVGTGDAQDELQRVYREDTDKNAPLLYRPEITYNAHSQYLQTFIELGIAGIGLWLFCLALPAYKALQNRNFLLLAFVALFAFSCLTESMLSLNKGIVFFSFFLSLFAAANGSEREMENVSNGSSPEITG